MDIRKSAADLSGEERDRLLEALIRLKHRPAPGAPAGLSRYDQLVLLHGAIMAVLPPGSPPGETVNYAHWNIGFCPWHRMFVREFERALQLEVPGVTVPYWDWADHQGTVDRVFGGEFLGSLRRGSPAPVTDSVLRSPVPEPERPGWWPDGAEGFRVHPWLANPDGPALARGTGEAVERLWAGFWGSPGGTGEWLEQIVVEMPDVHPFWFFWTYLEQGGYPQLPAGTRRLPTHNAGHNFIGGHMVRAYSPNDPAFWLHHANVDRLWANWQRRRLAAVAGSVPADHYPPQDEEAPFGDPAPPGHRIGDLMWPWVGDTPGYQVSEQVSQLLPDYTQVPAVRVRDVLDTETVDEVGYRYAPPSRSGT